VEHLWTAKTSASQKHWGQQRDVIEYGIVDDIDLNGWDVRKALRLFWRSNPAFVEWVQSPIVYIEHGGFAELARGLLRPFT